MKTKTLQTSRLQGKEIEPLSLKFTIDRPVSEWIGHIRDNRVCQFFTDLGFFPNIPDHLDPRWTYNEDRNNGFFLSYHPNIDANLPDSLETQYLYFRKITPITYEVERITSHGARIPLTFPESYVSITHRSVCKANLFEGEDCLELDSIEHEFTIVDVSSQATNIEKDMVNPKTTLALSSRQSSTEQIEAAKCIAYFTSNSAYGSGMLSYNFLDNKFDGWSTALFLINDGSAAQLFSNFTDQSGFPKIDLEPKFIQQFVNNLTNFVKLHFSAKIV